MRADNDGAAVVSGSRSAGTGYIAYVAAVVRTIRNERRGLDRARHIVRRRRIEAAGKEAEALVRREGASGGKGTSAAAAAASAFKRFLRRCGGSDI